MKDDKLYILHISERLDRIDRYVSEGEEQFMKGKVGIEGFTRFTQ